MLRVGLTGGIATGKSVVLRRLEAAGFHTLDLDRVAHELIAPGGAACADVVAAFGPDVVAGDGGIDRKALGERVFADPSARAVLERILHPRIRAREAVYAGRYAGTAGAVAVTDAALLVETGMHLRFDRLVVVHCPPDEQLRRLMARDGLTEAAARARIEAQMSTPEKLRFAHFVVDTSGTLGDAVAEADAVADELRALAGAAPRAAVVIDRAAAALGESPEQGPRGLRPRRIAEEIAETGMVDLGRIATMLDPPHRGPWYTAAARGDAPEGPEALAVPVALWCLGRGRGVDLPYAMSAAASVALLTHRDPRRVAGACLAVAAIEEALAGTAEAVTRNVSAWAESAARWGGAPPPPSVLEAALSAALAVQTAPARAEQPLRSVAAALLGPAGI